MSLNAPSPVAQAVEEPQPRLTLVEPRPVDPSVAAPAVEATATHAETEDSEAAQAAPPSGWYPDPNGGGLLRWWSGEVWTSVVRPPVSAVLNAPAPSAVTAPAVPAAMAADAVAAPTERGDEYDWGRESAGRASREYTRSLTPSASVGHRAAWQDKPTPTRSHTAAVWILAFLPYVQIVAAGAVLTVLGRDDQALLLLAVSFLLITFVLAIRDSSVLRREGYRRAPQSAWALLGPLAYLIARAVTIKRQNGSPTSALWVWIINSLLAMGLVAGLALTVGKPYLQYFGVEL